MRSLRLTSLIIASLVGPAEASAQDATSSEFRGPFSKYSETCIQDWDAASPHDQGGLGAHLPTFGRGTRQIPSRALEGVQPPKGMSRPAGQFAFVARAVGIDASRASVRELGRRLLVRARSGRRWRSRMAQPHQGLAFDFRQPRKTPSRRRRRSWRRQARRTR
jgi:hypothetical protein